MDESRCGEKLFHRAAIAAANRAGIAFDEFYVKRKKKSWTEFLTVCGGLPPYDGEIRLRFPVNGVQRDSEQD